MLAPNTAIAMQGDVRPFLLKGTLAFGQTSYGAQKCVGALKTVSTGLPAGTYVRLVNFGIFHRQSNISTPQSLIVHLFDENPSDGTYGDNATLAAHANDEAKAIAQATVAIASATGAIASWVSAFNNVTAAVDAEGKLYFSLVSAAASLVFSGASSLSYRLGLQF